MEHFIKIAFCLVTVTITLSSYPTVSSGKAIRIKENNIDSMQKSVKCPSDSLFYAPEIGTNKQKCITAALTCIEKELEGTVKAECDDENGEIDQALEILEGIIKQRQKNSSEEAIPNDCACERWSEVSFSEFLEKYKSLLEFVASG